MKKKKKFVRGAEYKAVVSATGHDIDHKCKYLLTEIGKRLNDIQGWDSLPENYSV